MFWTRPENTLQQDKARKKLEFTTLYIIACKMQNGGLLEKPTETKKIYFFSITRSDRICGSYSLIKRKL